MRDKIILQLQLTTPGNGSMTVCRKFSISSAEAATAWTISLIFLIVASFTVRVTVGGREVLPTVSSLKGKKASFYFEYSQNVYMSQAACYVPASIAFVIPQRQNLSGVLLKPLRTWDYPSSLPFLLKRRCLMKQK